MIKHRYVADEDIGGTDISISDMAQRPTRELVLKEPSEAARVVTGNASRDVTIVRVSIDAQTLPSSWPKPVESPSPKKFAKHLLIITRGTRGDVQPFIALGRALAEEHNWLVTICTEFRYKHFIKQNSGKLKQGCIRFRIAGGDTHARVDSRVSKWAMHLESDVMQHIMLANSEREFFDSEPAMYYWAKTLKPDYLMFGFTLANVAMIISESLKIPLAGFVLQPTSIPSYRYPPVIHLDPTVKEGYVYRLKEMIVPNRFRGFSNHVRHSTFSGMKIFTENNFLTGPLNSMRRSRGLIPIRRVSVSRYFYSFKKERLRGIVRSFKSLNTWAELQYQNVPLIMPINEAAFGVKPSDWGASSCFTNYLFLRGETVPPLSVHQQRFIQSARDKNHKLLVLAFSSMPVGKFDIFKIAVEIVQNCMYQVSIVVLLGDHPYDNAHNFEVENQVEQLVLEGRLLIDKGAPFGRLFPLMDAVVAHGGCGTTAEAIMSGVPVIVTGVLLFDQRFWGSRCHDLKIGPYPIHINKFLKSCVPIMNRALDPDFEWAQNARIVGASVTESMHGDCNGCKVNAYTVKSVLEQAPVYDSFDPIGKFPIQKRNQYVTKMNNWLSWILFHNPIYITYAITKELRNFAWNVGEWSLQFFFILLPGLKG